MFIVSTDKKSIVNTEQVSSIYIGSNETTVKVDFNNGKGCQIGSYQSLKECQLAISFIAEAIERKAVIRMPSVVELHAQMSREQCDASHKREKTQKSWRFIIRR